MDHNNVIGVNNDMAAMAQAFIMAGLTPAQIRYMTDYLMGIPLSVIAKRNSVSLSTVSHTVAAAKQKLNRLYGSSVNGKEV